jgi:hypothetical protein
VAEEAEYSEVRDPNNHPTHRQPEERATNIQKIAARDEVKAITPDSPNSRPNMPPPIHITETFTNSTLMDDRTPTSIAPNDKRRGFALSHTLYPKEKSHSP